MKIGDIVYRWFPETQSTGEECGIIIDATNSPGLWQVMMLSGTAIRIPESELRLG